MDESSHDNWRQSMVIVLNIAEDGDVTSLETDIDSLTTEELHKIFSKAIALFETALGHSLH